MFSDWKSILFALYRVYLPKSITYYYHLSGVDFAQFLNLAEIFLSSLTLSPIVLSIRLFGKNKREFVRFCLFFCFRFHIDTHTWNYTLHVVVGPRIWKPLISDSEILTRLDLVLFWHITKEKQPNALKRNYTLCVNIFVSLFVLNASSYFFSFVAVFCIYLFYFVNFIDIPLLPRSTTLLFPPINI